ncbi:PilN domain-containing protein [Nisaea acidiphila]|uniref:PilN domain-containing protein n=1 Tax=Nisaea acidiphila TaxID=1862145 RepID=A0A9J7APV4_9PROT|nr:PilN domain-containing protein [Nisaea acidiphila]UUX48625.1 PilN domain-containing protein [Nisaea acidiphila]
MTGLGAFIDAWGDGLVAGLPTRLRFLVGRSVTLVDPLEEGFRLFGIRGGKVQPRGKATSEDLSRQIGQLGRPVALAMPEGARVTVTLSVPASARRSLGPLLDGEVERLTPFKRSEVRLAYDLLEERDGKLQIRLHVVPKVRLDQVRQQFEIAGGGAPDLLVAGTEQFDAPSAVDFSGAPVVASRANAAAWIGLLSVLLLAAILSPAPKPYLALENVTRETERLRPQVAALQSARSDFLAQRELAGRFQDLLRASPDVAGLLEQVTVAVPDDAWLTGFVIARDRLTVEGFARDASGLLERIEAVAGLSEARFEAPVTREPGSGRERFRIVARLGVSQ